MMRSSGVFILSVLLLTLLISSCKTTRRAAAPVRPERQSAELLLQQMLNNNRNYPHFTARARMSYNDGQSGQSFTSQFRFVEDSVLWASVTALLGIEVARAVITPDSIKVMDRLNRQYIFRSMNSLDGLLPFPADLSLLSDLLLGNFISDEVLSVRADVDDRHHLLMVETPTFRTTHWLHPQTYLPARSEYDDRDVNRRITINFENYRTLDDGKQFSFNRNVVVVQDQRRMVIDIEYQRVDLQKPTEFPFTIPENYAPAE